MLVFNSPRLFKSIFFSFFQALFPSLLYITRAGFRAPVCFQKSSPLEAAAKVMLVFKLPNLFEKVFHFIFKPLSFLSTGAFKPFYGLLPCSPFVQSGCKEKPFFPICQTGWKLFCIFFEMPLAVSRLMNFAPFHTRHCCLIV